MALTKKTAKPSQGMQLELELAAALPVHPTVAFRAPMGLWWRHHRGAWFQCMAACSAERRA